MSRSLILTFVLSVGALVGVAGWLLADGATSNADALKTGGLAAGAVVALYALWLNDRRRQVEEQRQDVERRRQALETERHELDGRRAEHDRERVADERFARAVELLGHEADQVRVGALHALVGLAASRPRYTQTVLDVLCSYLRRPFDHPHYADDRLAGLPEDADPGDGPDGPDGPNGPDGPDPGPADVDTPWAEGDRAAADRERQVRRAAQRLITDLLTRAGATGPDYDLDLTDATLEYLDLRGRRIGSLTMRYARLYRSTKLGGLQVHGTAWFTSATFHGPLYGEGAVFHRDVVLTGAALRGRVTLDGARFAGVAKLAAARFTGPVSLAGATVAGGLDLRDARFAGDLDLSTATPPTARTIGMLVDTRREVRLPAAWQLEPVPGTRYANVR